MLLVVVGLGSRWRKGEEEGGGGKKKCKKMLANVG